MTFDLKKMVLETNLPYPKRRGKVRDVYDLGDRMLMVSTDRISAFDWVLPVGIPGKGIVLNQLSCFWFQRLDVAHHLIGTALDCLTELFTEQRQQLAGRSMLTRKASVIPFECVVRGYLEGSGWREYQKSGSVCGIPLPTGLRQCDRLPEPIFTPATKAEQGHDVNVSFEEMSNSLGMELSQQLREQSLNIYHQGSQWALEKGVIIADTKFEWGWCDQELTLIDEVLTPDSSRFWPLDLYQPGRSQPSFDKQFVREWLMGSSWDQHSPPPALPDSVVEQTREKYLSVYRMLTDSALASSLH